MAKKIKKLIFIFAALLFVGAGCGSSENINSEIPDEIFRKPDNITNPLTEAYKYCEQAGNRIVVQYDAATSDSKVFCVFSNNSQCDALAFKDGACSKGNGAKVFTGQQLSESQLIRSCGVSDPAVCGVDGKNYTNSCIAALQNIPVLHSGVCTKNDSSLKSKSSGSSQTDSQNNQNSQSSQNSQNQVDSNTGDSANWLNMVIGLSTSQPPKSPRSKISKCSIDKQTYYYFEQGNPEHFSVLYDEDGETHCFPGNDVTQVCPENFSGNACKQIWRDAR
jgi:hypothetical protein